MRKIKKKLGLEEENCKEKDEEIENRKKKKEDFEKARKIFEQKPGKQPPGTRPRLIKKNDKSWVGEIKNRR